MKLLHLLLLVLATCLWPLAQVHAQSEAQASDELLLQSARDTNEAYTIHAHDALRVWTSDGRRRQGRLESLKNGKALVGLPQIVPNPEFIPVDSIVKVRFYSVEIGEMKAEKYARRGWRTMAIGLLGLVGGLLVLLATGLAGIGVSTSLLIIGSLTFVVGLFLWLASVNIRMGVKPIGHTFNLKKGWRLREVPPK